MRFVLKQTIGTPDDWAVGQNPRRAVDVVRFRMISAIRSLRFLPDKSGARFGVRTDDVSLCKQHKTG